MLNLRLGALLFGLLPAVCPLSSGAADSGAGTTNTDAASASILDPRYGAGSWIWESTTRGRQECRLWKTFVFYRLKLVQ
jgi:hypothetical protein